MKCRVLQCESCGGDIEVWREDRHPRYCSQRCAKNTHNVNTESADKNCHVQVSVFTRDRLREISDRSHSRTITRLAGLWANVNTKIDSSEYETSRYGDTTTIRVSGSCYDTLKRIRDNTEANSIGTVVSVFIESDE